MLFGLPAKLSWYHCWGLIYGLLPSSACSPIVHSRYLITPFIQSNTTSTYSGLGRYPMASKDSLSVMTPIKYRLPTAAIGGLPAQTANEHSQDATRTTSRAERQSSPPCTMSYEMDLLGLDIPSSNHVASSAGLSPTQSHTI